MPQRLLFATLIAGVCTVALAACGSSDSSTSTEAPAASSAAAPASTVAATTAAATTAAATTAAATTAAASTEDNGGGSESQGDPVAGKTVFTSNCGGCHTLADAGTSGQVGPDLDQLKPDFDRVEHQVENGGGVMPAFEGTLSDDDIHNVAAYVSSVAGQ